MPRTTVSSKFQVVIPKEVRDVFSLRKGEVLQVVSKDGVISLIPDRPILELRGFLKGMKVKDLREKRDRL